MAISTKITLDGEEEYRKQLQGIDAALKQNKAEMEKLSAVYAGNENSVEALTAKGELLTKQMELEEQRVDTLMTRLAEATAIQFNQIEAVEKARAELEKQTAALAAMENAEDTSAEAIEKQRAAVDQAKEALEKQERSLESANKAVQDYELQLTKAETKVIKASNAVEDNSKALDENKKALEKNENESKSLGDVLSDLADKVGVKLPEGIKKGTDSINAGTAATAAWAAAAGTMIELLIKSTKETAALTDELATQSIQTGISTDTLQAWNYAAGLMDVEASTVTGSMTKLTRAMAAAQKGSEAQVQAFRRLHVAYKDANGQLRDTEDVWWDSIEALGKIHNETERDTVAMTLFGQSAQNLNTVIAAGREGFEGFRQEAEQMGYIMGQEQIDRFNRLSDAMDRFDNVQLKVKATLGEALLPILTKFFELLEELGPEVIANIAGLVMGITVATSIARAVGAVADAVGVLSGSFGGLTGKLLIILPLLIALVALFAVLAGKSNEVNTAMQSTMQSTSSAIKQAQAQAGTTTGRIPAYADGTDYHPGGWAIVGERGREAVWLPRGARVLTNEQTERAMSGAPRYADGIGFGGVVINETNEFKVDSLEDYLAIKEWHRKRQLSRRKGYAPV